MAENQVTLRQALFETRNGDPKRALTLWQAIIERDVHNGPARHISGLLCMKLEEFADAEKHFREAVRAQPENWEYHKDLGMAIEARKGVQASIDHFRRSIFDCRTNPDMYVVLASQLLAKKSYLAALDAVEASLRMEPTYVDAWLLRSRALVHINDLDSAGASLAMARFLDPDRANGPTPDWARAYSFLWSAPRRAPRLGAGRVAICMSGSCEALQYTVNNVRTHLLDRIPNADLFVVAFDDGHAQHVEQLNPRGLEVGVEPILATEPFRQAHLRSGSQTSLKTTLNHLQARKQVGALMGKHSTNYDAVIYIRPDAWMKTPFPEVSRLDLAVLRTPHQDLRGGLNGCFAVGSFEDMGVYLNQIDAVLEKPERLAMGRERSLMRHLIQSGVIPVLDPRLETRVVCVEGGRMVLQAPDWLVRRVPECAPA